VGLLPKIALSLVLSLMAIAGHSQPFPGRPIRIVIGFPPGGGIDVVARMLAPRLSQALGQPVIVDNRPGANGVLATDLVAKSPADGHTVFMGTLGNLAMNPTFYASLPFNMDRDLAPLTQVASVSFMLIAHPSAPYKTVPELVAYAKANPAKVNYSSSGNGSTPHLAGELFNLLAGVKTTHIPYKGSAPMITDLIAGQVQISYDSVATSMQHVSSGKLRAIAGTGPRRMPALPNLPAVSETVPGYEVVNWYGMVVPAGTPREAIARLRNEILQLLNTAEIRDKLLALGTDPVGSTPEEFEAFLKAETIKWARVIKEANIRVE
jgi:tripartite-type tricarboxylate transporter receptor subunit TctC